MPSDVTKLNSALPAILCSDDMLLRLNVLVGHDNSQANKDGIVVRESLRDLYNDVLGNLFPSVAYIGPPQGDPFGKMDYIEPKYVDDNPIYPYDTQRNLRFIEANRKHYKRRPDILAALDVLEVLAKNAGEIRHRIKETYTPSQISGFRNAFLERYGDPVCRIIIGSRPSILEKFIDNTAEFTLRLWKKRPKQLASRARHLLKFFD